MKDRNFYRRLATIMRIHKTPFELISVAVFKSLLRHIHMQWRPKVCERLHFLTELASNQHKKNVKFGYVVTNDKSSFIASPLLFYIWPLHISCIKTEKP